MGRIGTDFYFLFIFLSVVIRVIRKIRVLLVAHNFLQLDDQQG